MSSVLHTGNCLEILPGLPEQSVHCVVTSPPYFGLRDYGVTGQLGLEKTPEEYISNLVNIFREIWWVLRDDGTCWLNLGDSFANIGKSGGSSSGKYVKVLHDGHQTSSQAHGGKTEGLKPKDLMGIPWRVALALQADGWYLRSDIIEEVELYCPCGCGYTLEERIWRHEPDREIIWAKKNPMPESVRDRPTKTHEYIFLLTKSEKYFYDCDAIREQTGTEMASEEYEKLKNSTTEAWYQRQTNPFGDKKSGKPVSATHPAGRNKRSVWSVATQSFPGAHFATFPQELIKPCILAGTSEAGCCAKCGTPWERVVERESSPGVRGGDGHAIARGVNRQPDRAIPNGADWYANTNTTRDLGFRPACICYKPGPPVPCTVLDPFNGAGTTGVVCKAHNRHYIGIDLKPEYIKMSQDRLEKAPDYKNSHAAFMAKLEKTLALRRARRVPKPLK